jgi:hypothetical protein
VLAQAHHSHVGEALLPHRLHQRPRHLRRGGGEGAAAGEVRGIEDDTIRAGGGGVRRPCNWLFRAKALGFICNSYITRQISYRPSKRRKRSFEAYFGAKFCRDGTRVILTEFWRSI